MAMRHVEYRPCGPFDVIFDEAPEKDRKSLRPGLSATTRDSGDQRRKVLKGWAKDEQRQKLGEPM